jgi:hypothetical protein
MGKCTEIYATDLRTFVGKEKFTPQCNDFKNVFDEKFSEKIGVFDSKQS